MKKYLVSAFALVALLASCAKENVPATVEEKADAVEIRANIINDDTKTDYSISGNTAYFHWTGTETIGRLRYKEGLFGHDAFTSTTEANNGETSLIFQGTSSSYQTDYAMYPIWNGTDRTGIGWSSSPIFKLYLNESMAYNPDAPLKNVVPMIAKLNTSGQFDFVPVTGVIAVTVKNLPTTADKITLSSTEKALSGNYRLTSNPSNYAANIDYVITNGLTITLASNDGNTNGTKSFTFSGLDKGSHVFYFPVSVGTFDDMTITVYAGNTSLQTVKTTKPITVAKGQIVQFPEMDLAKATKVSITGNANEAYLYVDTFGPDATSVKFAVASTEAAASSSVASGTTITAAGEANKKNIFTELTVSGQYYLAYSVFDSSNNVLRTDVKPVNHITTADAAALAKAYTLSYSSSGISFQDNAKTMTLVVSDDIAKGNLMLTEFMGAHSDISLNDSNVLTYTIAGADAYTMLTANSAASGSPVYGTYSAGTNKLIFLDTLNQPISKNYYGNPNFLHNYYADQPNLSFAVNKDSDGSSTHRLVADAGYIVLSWGTTYDASQYYYFVGGLVAD